MGAQGVGRGFIAPAQCRVSCPALLSPSGSALTAQGQVPLSPLAKAPPCGSHPPVLSPCTRCKVGWSHGKAAPGDSHEHLQKTHRAVQISVTGTELQEPALNTELPAQRLPCALREAQLKCLCVRSSTLQLFTTTNRGNCDPGLQEGAGSLPHSAVLSPSTGVCHLTGALCWAVRHCRGKPRPW